MKTDLTSKRNHVLEVRKHRGLMRTTNHQAELNLVKEIKIKSRRFLSYRNKGEQLSESKEIENAAPKLNKCFASGYGSVIWGKMA